MTLSFSNRVRTRVQKGIARIEKITYHSRLGQSRRSPRAVSGLKGNEQYPQIVCWQKVSSFDHKLRWRNLTGVGHANGNFILRVFLNQG